jgi:hypothetical protein
MGNYKYSLLYINEKWIIMPVIVKVIVLRGDLPSAQIFERRANFFWV